MPTVTDQTITGTARGDSLRGGAGNDHINGLGGNDTIDGGAGNDTINAGGGNDLVYGGDGNDVIDGGEGNDLLWGGAGDDVILGGAGNDFLDGDCGNDTLDGGAGANLLYGDDGNDTLIYRAADHAGEGTGICAPASLLDGGCDIDTLKLVLTRDEWLRSDVQADVARYIAFLAQHVGRSGEADCIPFCFNAFNLTVLQIEKLVVVVDGLTVDPRDEGVTARADAITVTEDTPNLAFNLLANDSVPDLVKSVTITNPAHGTVVLTQNYADPANPIANVVYTPNATYYQYLAAGERATDTFTYTVTDADGDVSTQTVTVTILGQNDGPAIVSGKFTGAVTEDSGAAPSATGAIVFSDLDLTDTHSVAVGAARVSVTGAAPAGFAGANGFGALTAAVVENTTDQNNQGTINWTFAVDNAAVQRLAAGQVATQVYTLTLTDRNGASVTQDVTVTLTGTNDGPTITTATAAGAIVEDGATAATGNIGFADVDLIDTHSVTAIAQGTGYRGTFAAVIDNVATSDGVGNVKWNFAADNATLQDLAQGETLTQKYTVTIKDNNGALVTSVVTVTITGTNDVPVITSTSAAAAGGVVEAGLVAGGNTALAGTPATSGQLSSSDVDHGATAAWSGSASGTYGSFAIDAATGRWTYLLDNGRAATNALAAGDVATDRFLATVTDDKGATATQWVTVTVTGSNDGPVAVADTGAVREDSVLAGSVATNDSDVDRAATRSYSLLSGFAGLTLNANGSYSFDAGNAAYQALAKDEILVLVATYQVRDDQGATATAALTVTVTGTNDAPVAVADVAAVKEDCVVTGNVGTNDTDIDHGATRTFALAAPVAGLTLNADGSYSFDAGNAAYQALAKGETRVVVATYVVTDQYGATAQSTLSVTVTGANDGPVVTSTAAASAGAVREAGVATGGNTPDAGTPSATGQMTSSDVDNGATATWSGSATGTYGSFMIGADGRWTYLLDNARAATNALAAGETRTETFTVTVTDDQAATATQLVTIIVTGTNDAPIITSTAAASAGAVREAGLVDGGNTADAGTLCATGQLTSTDVDNGATATWSGAAAGTYGSFAVTAAGKWTYTLDNGRAATDALAAGETKTESFTVTVTDDKGATATQLVSVSVTGTNDAPVVSSAASAATGAVREAGVRDGGNVTETGTASAAGQLTSTDVDHGATASWSGSTNGIYGSFAIGADGRWSYQLDNTRAATSALAAGAVRADSFLATVTDDHGATATQLVTLTVTGTNDAPVVTSTAAASAGAVREAGLVDGGNTADAGTLCASGQLTSTDVDTGATATWSGAANGVYGSLTITAAGKWIYTLDNGRPVTSQLAADETKTESFIVTVTDDRGATATQVVTIIVTGTNDGPVAVADTAMAVEDQPVVTGSVATNDSDVDHGAALRFALDGPVAGLTLAADGGWRFDPTNAAYQALAKGEQQLVVASYTVTDDHGATATASLTITVTGTNDAPTAQVDVTTAIEDGPLVVGTVAANDGDIDHGAVLRWALTGPIAGLTLGANGSYSFNPGDAAYQSLAAGESLTVVAPYAVTDDQGVTAYSALIIVLTGTNDAPVVTSTQAAASGTVSENGIVAGVPAAMGTLTSADVDHGATATWSGSANGVYGSFAIGADGKWTYLLDNSRAVVDALAAGETRIDQFTATVTDDKGATATQLVTVTVLGSNDAPIVTSNAAAATGAVREAGVANGGNTPDAGTPSTTGQLSSSDVDHGATATWSGSANGQYGSFAIDPATGRWTYLIDNARASTNALAAGEQATDSFTATVTDDKGATATQAVTVTLTGTNDAPVVTSDAAAASGQVREAGVFVGGNTPDAGVVTATGQLTSSDVDHGATATWSGNATGGYGSFTIDAAAGRWVYTLDNGRANGLAQGQQVAEQFTTIVTDDHGATATQVVTVIVTGTNDAPTVAPMPVTATAIEAGTLDNSNQPAPGTPVITGQFVASDADAGAQLSWSGNANGQFGTLAVAGDGRWAYVIDNTRANFLAAGDRVLEIFTVFVRDEFGATTPQQVLITVTGTNDAPIAVADTAATSEDSVITGSVAGNDSDPDHGAVLRYALQGSVPGLTMAADGSYRFDAGNAAFQALAQGQTVPVIATYRVTDEHGAFSLATLTITLTGTNDAPVVTGGTTTGTVIEAGVVDGGNQATPGLSDTTGQLVASDIDTGATLTWSGGGAGAYGQFATMADGSWRYHLDNNLAATQALAAGETRQETFTATVTDEFGATATQVVTITVIGTNDAPTVVSGGAAGAVAEAGVQEGGNTPDAGNPSAAGQLLSADVDHSATATWSGSGNGHYGAFAIAPGTGAWTYALDNSRAATQALAAGQVATESFTATVTDDHGATATQVVTITVTGTNDAPVATADTGAVIEDHVLTGTVAGNDSDVDAGAVLSYALDAPVAGLTLAADGSYRFDAGDDAYQALALGEHRSVVAHYTVTDEHGATSQTTLTIDVIGANDAPVANPDASNGGAAGGGGQPTGAPADFLIAASGFGTNFQPSISHLAAGGFVAAWNRSDFATGQSSIGFQLFDAGGNKIGGVHQSALSSDAYRTDSEPQVGQLANGGFVVAWTHYDNVVGYTAVHTQVYDATGVAVGGEVTTGVADGGTASQPTVTGLANGGFVIGFTAISSALADSDVDPVLVQLFDASGQPVGGSTQANTSTPNGQLEASITALAGGGFVVVWRDDIDSGEIRAQQFDSNGAKVGGEVHVNTTTPNVQFQAKVAALAGGGYVVTWTDTSNYVTGNYDDSYDIRGQIIGANGVPIGGEFLVNMPTADYQDGPTVAALPGGGFVVAWRDDINFTNGNNTDGADIRAQVFDASGARVGAPFVVNASGPGSQLNPSISASGDGFVVSWEDYGDQFSSAFASAIVGRLFTIAASGNENASVKVDVVANDTDVDHGAVLTLTQVNVAAGHGHVSIVDNQLFFDPGTDFDHLAAGATETVTVTYTIVDEHGAPATSVATITLTGANDAPVALNDTGAGSENTLVLGSVAGNDSDVDDDAVLSYVLVSPVAGLTLNANGSYTLDASNPAYDHLAAGEHGIVTATYRVTDDHGASSTATLTIDLTGANDAPVAVDDDGGFIDEDRSLLGSVAVNDSDPDSGAVLAYTLDTPVAGLTLGTDGGYTFDAGDAAYQSLADGELKVVMARYTVTDDHGATASATLTIYVAGTNDAPVVTGAVTGTATEDGAAVTLNALTNASDVDSGALAVTDIDPLPAGVTYNPATKSFTLDPANAAYQSLAAGETQVVTVSYSVFDGLASTPATVRWTVTGTNDAPVAALDFVVVKEDVTLAASGNVLANDSDIDHNDLLSVVSVRIDPNSGIVRSAGAGTTLIGQLGTLTINADGSYSYQLDNNNPQVQALAANSGTAEQFLYTVRDASGAAVEGRLTIAIQGTNDAPVVTGAVTGTAIEDGAASTLNALATASDVDTGTMLIVVGIGALPAGVSYDAATKNFTLDPANAAYQSLAQGETTVVTVTYAVSDGIVSTPASASWTVTGTNDAPVALADTTAVLEDASVSGSVATNDSDVDHNAVLTYSLDAPVAGLTFNADGSYSFDARDAAYQPLAAGASQVVVANYSVTDDQGAVAHSTLTTTITGVNDAPSGADGTVTMLEDTSYSIRVADLGFSDVDGNALAGVKIATLPTAGSFTLNGVAVTAGQIVSVADLNAGKLVYTPGVNGNGTSYASYQFQVRDDGGTADGGVDLDPTPNRLTFDVLAVNDAPTTGNVSRTMLEDGTYTVTRSDIPFADAADGNALAAIKIVNLPAAGLLRLNGASVTANQVVSVADLMAGKLTFAPAANATGAGYTAFGFAVIDDGGTLYGGNNTSGTSAFSFTVLPVNDAPSALDKSVTILEDASYTVAVADLGFSDTIDLNTLLAVKLGALPAAGSLKLNGVAVTAGQTVLATDIAAGKLIYTPALNGNGAAYAQINFQVQDNGGTANGGIDLDPTTHHITLNVTPVNDAPTLTAALIDQLVLGEAPLNYTFAANSFTDVDSSLTYSATLAGGGALPSWVSFNPITHAFTGTAPVNNTVASSFDVTVTATDGQYSTADTFTVTVSPNTYTGTSGNDSFTGTARSELIIGNGGNDTLVGGAGDDILWGDGKDEYGPSAAAVSTLTATAQSYYTHDRSLIGGLGNAAGLTGAAATAGFGENYLAKNDDGSTAAISITGVFGATGLNFFGTNYTSLYVNNNGNITFGSAYGAYVPSAIASSGLPPLIAIYWTDIDTRANTSVSTGGNSKGTNLVYWDVDSINHVFTATWDDVGEYSSGTVPNAFQLQLVDRGSGNFDIIYRYEIVQWNHGAARAGYSGGGTAYELPDSVNRTELNLDTDIGNTGITGVYVFQVRNGQVSTSSNDILDGGAGHDTLIGGPGADTFIFRAGQADGDTILDFNGSGSAAGDTLAFYGYGTAAQGATFVQVDATHWQVNSANGQVHEVITVSAGTTIDPTDFSFFP